MDRKGLQLTLKTEAMMYLMLYGMAFIEIAFVHHFHFHVC